VASSDTGADIYPAPIDVATEPNSHLIEPLMDSLALHALLCSMNGSLTLEDTRKLIESASTEIRTSEERLTEALFRLLLKGEKFLNAADPEGEPADDLAISDARGIPGGEWFLKKGDINARAAFHDAVLRIQSAVQSQGPLSFRSLVGMPPDQLTNLAVFGDLDAMAYRYALRQLNPFAVFGPAALYEPHNEDGELDIHDPDAGTGAQTNTWIADRAALLQAVLASNMQDKPDIALIPGTSNISTEFHYYASGSEQVLLADPLGRAPAGKQRTQAVMFADDGGRDLVGRDYVLGDRLYGGAGGDTIAGNSGDDFIEGGAGNDIIMGGAGNDDAYGGSGDDRIEGGMGGDYLEGGVGFDTYVIDAADDLDTIRDSDGLGQVIFNGRTLTGGTQIAPNLYEDAVGTRYVSIANAAGSKTVASDGGVLIEDYSQGDLGITLSDSEYSAPTAPQIAATRAYAIDPLYTTGIPFPSDRPEYVPGSLDNLLLRTFVNLWGSDASDSFVYAPSYGTFFSGFYGRAGQDLIRASGETAAGLVDGGADDDLIDMSALTVGMSLAGGGGNDYILGGSENDIVNGDNYTFANAYGQFGGVMRLDNFLFNLRDAFGDSYSYTEAQLAVLENSGVFLNSPPLEAPGETIYECIEYYDGVDAALRYLELETWTFDGGLPAVLAYLVGADATFDDYIDAGAGNDQVAGGSGSDTIYGGEGDDTLVGDGMPYAQINELFGSLASMFGAPGDDYIDGGGGNDQIADQEEGDDILLGGAGDDTISSSSGFDYIDGGDGADQISASGAGVIFGGAGDDRIEAFGSFYVDGGPGDDALSGEVLNGGEGNDVLRGNWLEGGEGSDVLSGSNEGSTFVIHPYELGIDVIGDGDPDPEGEASMGTDVLSFGLGISLADLALSWGEIYGSVSAHPSDSSLAKWHETLNLAWGVNQGVRIVVPNSGDAVGSGIEYVEFADGSSISFAELKALAPERVPAPGTPGDDLIFGSSDGDVIESLGGHDQILAGDGGDVVYGGEGDDNIEGGAGDDVLYGGAGSDELNGGPGSDTYVFARGDGGDVIDNSEYGSDGIDVIWFDSGISPSDIVVTRDSDLHFGIRDTGDSLTVKWWNRGSGYRIDAVQFSDGTVWDQADIDAQVVIPQGTEGNDNIVGGASNDYIDGKSGDDRIIGGDGDDVLIGGDGDDQLSGGGGNDLIRGSAGFDYIDDSNGGSNLIDAGADDDYVLVYGQGRNLIVGGVGDDWIEDYGNGSVIAFNPGDGNDTVYAAGSLTLSIGGGVPPGDLMLASTYAQYNPDATDVILTVGSGADAIRLTREWEDDPQAWPTIMLQMFGSVHTYDFNAVIDELIAQAGGNPYFELDLDAVLPAFAISTSETEAVGGAIAWQYATTGSIDGLSDAQLQAVLADTDFGVAPQSIIAPAGNHAPSLANAIPDEFPREDAFFSFELPAETFSDPDAGDSLTYSATLGGGAALPAWLSFDAGTRTFSGTPLQADVGALEVTVTATDSGGLSAADTFALTIANVNDAPTVATPLADLSFEAGTPFSVGVPTDTFADEDPGDTLSLSATLFDGGALPAWLSFDPATARFTGNPALTDIGITPILVTATDTAGATAQSDFGLVVRVPAGTEATGSAGDDVIYGSTGDETLTARGGSDYLYGDIGNDLLKGGGGNDVLQGGAGNDVLRGGKGQNVLDGGMGDDLIFGGAGSAFIMGGAGNDTLRVGAGNDVIAFNAGDGMDTVYGGRDGGNTLSFGGGIRYSDLTLSKSGKDLVVSAGAGEGVTLKNWYGGNRSVLNLQIVLDATEEFDAGSSDPLYNRRVQTFDFLGMVSAFDAARAATPGLTSWEITNALLAFHLSGADDMALGGDLAYWYGKNRALSGISLQSAQQVIGSATFGSEAQSLRPFSGLQEGFVKLA
jgi:Ca2+-binding RTX toxin-like protein